MSRIGTRRAADTVGVAVFLASWAMLVVALAFAALSLRRAGAWTPLLGELGLMLPALSVAAIGASSIALATGRLRASLATAAVFVACLAVIVSRSAGLEPRAVQLASLLAGFHLIHVVVGAVALGRAAAKRRPAGLWSAYWHALALAWMLFAGVLFL